MWWDDYCRRRDARHAMGWRCWWWANRDLCRIRREHKNLHGRKRAKRARRRGCCLRRRPFAESAWDCEWRWQASAIGGSGCGKGCIVKGRKEKKWLLSAIGDAYSFNLAKDSSVAVLCCALPCLTLMMTFADTGQPRPLP